MRIVRLPLFQSRPKRPAWPGRCFAALGGHSAGRGAAPPGGWLGCIVSLFVKSVPKVGEARVERPQEFLVRKAAPIVGVEGLVPRGADASFDQSWVDDAREYG